MSHDRSNNIRAKATTGYLFNGWRMMLAILLMLAGIGVGSPSTVHGKGGDRLAGFPAIDLRSGTQYAKAMAVDSNGNIIVVGAVGSGSTDYFVVKFKSDGSGLAWIPKSYGGTGTDIATAVAVDSANDIVVTGYSWSGSNYDIHTIKYSGATGDVIWEHSWDNQAIHGDDYGTSLAIDSSDNIYVAGYSANGTKNDDFLVIKYPSGGSTPSWVELSDDAAYPNNINRFTSIAAGTGGIVVTGYSSKGGADFDILTRKYGVDGTIIREWRYSSPGSREDRGVVVKMDTAGYVAVTGFLTNAFNNKDMYTVKYHPGSNTPVWEKTYNNNGGSGEDEPRAMWIDALGDVYVAGSTGTLAGNTDFYTVRYNGSTGDAVWQTTFNAGDGSADVPAGIVVDDSIDGGVFVAGYTTVGSTEDFITIKYRKDNGSILWNANWNNTFNLNDRPVGIALSSRNVVVAGWTDGGASGNDFVALKYDFGVLNAPSKLTAAATSNTSITLTWADNSINEEKFIVQRKLGETGPWSSIDSPPSGFVVTSPAPPNAAGTVTWNDPQQLETNKYYYYQVVACTGTGASDCSYPSEVAHALTKVVTYVAPSWSYVYDGADHREDIPTDITFASDNHPVVTGYSELTEEGVEGMYTYDYMTIKLDRNDRSIKWKARFDSGDGGTDMAAGVALDSSGNLLVTGTAYLSGGSDKSDELYTRKVQTSTVTDPGAEPDFMWEDQFGTQSGIDYATAISMVRDGSNNSVVLGYGQNAEVPPDHNIFVIKLDNNGTRAWPPVVYDSERNDEPSGIAIDAAGDIFVTGYSFDKSENPEGSYDWFTAKYSGLTGDLIWSDTYNISQDVYARAGGNDQALAIDVDAAGNAYVTGYATNVDGQTVFYTVKYDGAAVPSGNRRIWEKAFNYSGFHAEGVAVKVDPIDGAVVVAGTAYVNAADSDFHLIRYNPVDGSLTEQGLKPFWQINFDRPGSYDYVTAMTIDSSGYIYLTGNVRGGLDTDPAFDGTSDIVSLIFDYEGTFLGAMTYDGTGRKDEATAITANYVGEAFIAGLMTNAANNPDYAVLKQINEYLLVPAPFTVTSNADSSKIDLGWQHNNPNATFVIERTPGPVTPVSEWSPIAMPGAGAVTYTDISLSSDTSYCYRINALYNTLPSRKVTRCATTRLVPPVLDAPAVDPDPMNLKITLSWTQVSGNTGYKIERKIGLADEWVDLANKLTNENSHQDTLSLTRGTIYYYRVSTNSPRGYSLPSNEGIGITSPVLNAPSNIANNQMTLTWDPVVGAASYTVEAKLDAGSYGSIAACTAITGTTCTPTNLTPGGQYLFHLKATAASVDSAWSNEVGSQAVLAVPTLTAPPAANFTDIQVSLSWSGVFGASTYTVEAKPLGGSYGSAGAGCTATAGTSCTATGLSPNTTYYFHVKASNAAGDSTWSGEQSGKTKLTTPSLTSAVGASTAQVNLVWTPVTGATGYTVEQASCSYSASTPSYCRGADGYYAGWTTKASNVVTPSYSATGLTAGTNYRYRITATVSGNSSAPSNIMHAWTYLTAPTVTITPTDLTSLTVSWDTQSGETSYAIERDSTVIVDPHPMNNVSYLNTGLQQQTQYCYRVKAYSTEPAPPPEVWSNPVCRTTPLPAPTFLTPTIVDTTHVKLDWNQIANNTGYEVERCPTTDNNQPVTHPVGTCVNISPKLATDVNTYTDTVTAGATNRYRVRAYYNNSADWTAFSTEWWVTAKPPTPTLGTPTVVSQSQLNLSWNNVFGDNGYSIFWKVRSGATCTDDNWDGPLAAALNATSYPHAGLTANTYYCYKIKANGPPGPPSADSVFSAIVTQTTLIATPTLNPATGITASNICLSWPNIMPNTGFKVERKTGAAGTWAQVGSDLPADNTNATVNWCNNSGLSSGTLYYYRISIKNPAGYSAVSNEQSATTTPAIPSITAATVSEDRIDVCWALAYGATSYRIERKIGSGGTYGQIANPSVGYSTSYCGEPYPSVTCTTPTAVTYCYQDTGLTENTTYFYQVYAANGTESPASVERTATTLSIASQSLTATPLNGGLMIRLDWTPIACSPDPCDNPEYFEIQRQVRDGLWMPLKIVDGTKSTHTDNVAIDPNCKYRYRIRSLQGALQSPFSEAEVFAKPYVSGTNVCR